MNLNGKEVLSYVRCKGAQTMGLVDPEGQIEGGIYAAIRFAAPLTDRKWDTNDYLITGYGVLDLSVDIVTILLLSRGHFGEAAFLKLGYNLVCATVPDVLESIRGRFISRKANINPQ